MRKIKICGITQEKELLWLFDNQVDYAGFVMFYPKSKRNQEEQSVKKLLETIDRHNVNNPDNQLHKAAVVVSPTKEQVITIQKLGFDLIQIHGELAEKAYAAAAIPILRAVNVSDGVNLKQVEEMLTDAKIAGVVFDGKNPGEGKTFDWTMISNLNRHGKLFVLAGGLNQENVLEGIRRLSPDIIDVSSGVENEDGTCKSEAKIAAFVRMVRLAEANQQKLL